MNTPKYDGEYLFLFVHIPQKNQPPPKNIFEFYVMQTLLLCVKKDQNGNQLRQFMTKLLKGTNPRFNMSFRHLGSEKDEDVMLSFSKTLEQQGVKNLSLLTIHK
jgi:hypothetical protein